jgi:hypothetical protein
VRDLVIPGLIVVALASSGCSGSSAAPTQEDLAQRACTAALAERLHATNIDAVTQTRMIGRRDFGWLVRGLSRDVSGSGARNYECRLDDAGSEPPTLTYLRLCEPGQSPWGCPEDSGR